MKLDTSQQDLARTSRSGRHRLVPVIAAALALALTACSGGGTGGESDGGPSTATVATLPIVPMSPLYVGIDEGLFSDEGLDLETKSSGGGSTGVTMVVSDEAQFGYASMFVLLTAIDQGLPIKIVSPQTATGTSGVAVPAGSDIASAKDLEGKTVGINAIGVGDMIIRAAVDADGGDSSEVDFVELPFPTMLGALDGGSVDAVWLVEPFLSQAAASPNYTVLFNPYDQISTEPQTASAFFATEAYIEQHPDRVKKFQAGIAAANDLVNGDEELIRSALGDYTELPPEVIAQIPVGTPYTDELDEESITRLAELMYEYGAIKKVPNPQDLVYVAN